MKFASVIYRLKQEYGLDCVLQQVSNPIVDATTGTEESNFTSFLIGKVIVLPISIALTVARQLVTSRHPSGAFYDKYDTIGLIDRRCLPEGVTVNTEDRLVFNDNVFVIGDLKDLHGEYFIEVGLTQLFLDRGKNGNR